jgi:ribosomal protein RSM22 (predicted rRNA methylase)
MDEVDRVDGVDRVDEVDTPPTLLLVSHVLNELSASQLAGLLETVRHVDELIWVESGTWENSRRLGAEVRERLLAGGAWSVVAPCTHRERCGMLVRRNERHWCHSFATTPREVFQDARWMHLGRELGIDLRATPYAFLVMTKREEREDGRRARLIGRPREYKGYSKLLSCEPGGVHERVLQKRDAPVLLKQVQSERDAPLFQWELADGKIVGGGPAA